MARLSFSFTAGILIRSRVKKAILSYCWSLDLNVEVREVRGIIGSTYYFKVTGPEKDVRHAYLEIESWLEELKRKHHG